ncbi:EAL domain-containing protein [Vibrio rotiferianus]|uniref:EAL domain-containing protein n=1 Tax=Vibrio rotiferianus TaxID=190895 RepID=UPI00406A54A8
MYNISQKKDGFIICNNKDSHSINFVFQEIHFNKENKVIGLEIFCQIESNKLEKFYSESEMIITDSLVKMIIKCQIEYIDKLNHHLPVSVNIPLPCLNDKHFITYLLSKNKSNIIIEISDISYSDFYSCFYELLKLKEQGFKLYLDDLSIQNVDVLLSFDWDFIKVDCELLNSNCINFNNLINDIHTKTSDRNVIYYNVDPNSNNFIEYEYIQLYKNKYIYPSNFNMQDSKYYH